MIWKAVVFIAEITPILTLKMGMIPTLRALLMSAVTSESQWQMRGCTSDEMNMILTGTDRSSFRRMRGYRGEPTFLTTVLPVHAKWDDWQAGRTWTRKRWERDGECAVQIERCLTANEMGTDER